MNRVLLALLVLAIMIGPAQPAFADDPAPLSTVVVKADPSLDPQTMAGQTGTELAGPMLASRGIWLFQADDDGRDDLEDLDGVDYAEFMDDGADAQSTGRQSSWNEGQPNAAAGGRQARMQQRAADRLNLAGAAEHATGAGVTVAIIDTGVDAGSVDGPVVGGWDLVDDDADASEEAMGVDTDADGLIDDAYGHGTHVAGIIALVAPDATILPLRVLDSDGNGSEYLAAEAILMAVEAGVDVINISFGSAIKSEVVEDAVKEAKDAGIILVAAAGNLGDDAKQYPAGHGGVIAVAAGDTSGGALADFSSRGGWVDLTAPGVDILSTAPGSTHSTWSGTSMATPFVAGAAALARQLDPQADSEGDMVNHLREGGSNVHDGGVGLLDFGTAMAEIVSG